MSPVLVEVEGNINIAMEGIADQSNKLMRAATIYSIYFLFIFFNATAQRLDADSTTAVEKAGVVNIYQDEALERMLRYHVIVNEEESTIFGYRVQIISSAARGKVLELKGECLQHFSDYKIHMVYQQPYFKLRIGDFQTRLEAYKFLVKIRTHFNDAFIVRDGIDIHNL